MGIAKMLLDEAAERYGFPTPFRRIKRLPVARAEVEPFTLEEVRLILDSVRPEFRDYYIARFFTGMRTGELDGLKWKYVDFERRLILVRETVVAGEEDTTKTEYSKRDIAMSEIVYEALRRQFEVTGKRSVYVFATGSGDHFDHNNVTKRVWYPLLRLLNLKKRQPKQTRHTAATLWLAAGENPEWIARQMGHANTQMLFTVYSRFVPNLTHQDGSAFERLTQRVFESPGKAAPAADPTKPGEDA
jgi:integrase